MSLKVMFVDMNAYFASVEQQFRPELRGRPIAVVPMLADTTCCIAASYEARKFGIKTGTLVRDARRMCPDLQLVEGRHELYVRVHHSIVAAVESCAPVHRIHSVDELSCRLSPACSTPDAAITLAQKVKAAVHHHVGEHLHCSVGLAPNTFLAKVASDMKKPDGLTVLAPDDLPHKLHPLELSDFPGIGPRMRCRIENMGIQSVEQLCALSADELERVWGGVNGQRFWHALRGHDEPGQPTLRRTVSHSHVLPPVLRTDAGAHAILVRLLCKAAARMRRLGYCAARLDVYMSFLGSGSWHAGMALDDRRDTSSLMDAFTAVWSRRQFRNRPLKVGLVLSNLVPEQSATLPLFDGERRRVSLSQMMDRINSRYGRDAVHLGTVHAVTGSAPTRIAFSNVPDFDDPANWDDHEKVEAQGLVPSESIHAPRELEYVAGEWSEELLPV